MAIVSEAVQFGHRKRMVTCPSLTHEVALDVQAELNKVIKTYYSWQHLYDRGWRQTKDPTFAEPGRGAVWICPECAKKYGVPDVPGDV